MIEDAERIRKLERDQATLAARLEGIDRQQAAQWVEFRALEQRQTAELNAIRKEQREGFDSLLTAINGNKLAWKMMDSNVKVAAWIILALVSIAGTGAAVLSALRRMMDG